MKENSSFNSDLKFVLVVAVTTSLERFTIFLLGLRDLDDSAIFIFLSIFQKIHKYLKMLFQKIKPIISTCYLYRKKKNYQEIIKINITYKTFYLNSVLRNTPTQPFLIAVLRNFQIITKTIPENNTLN